MREATDAGASRLKTAPRWLAPGAVPAGIAILYMPVFSHAAGLWAAYSQFSFGFVAPVACAILLFIRRDKLKASLARGSVVGLPVLLAGLVLLVSAWYQDVNPAKGISFLPTVLGAAAFLFGIATARALFAPALLLTASLSLYRGLLSSLGFQMQVLTAKSSAVMASLVGVTVHRSGVDLVAGQMHFTVVAGCSGMDSLLALLGLGLLMVSVVELNIPLRVALLASALPIALLANSLRVTAVLLLSQPLGSAVTETPLHEILSASVFLVSLTLLSVGLLLARKWQYAAR